MGILGTKLKSLHIDRVLIQIRGICGLVVERLDFNHNSVTFELESFLTWWLWVCTFGCWIDIGEGSKRVLYKGNKFSRLFFHISDLPSYSSLVCSRRKKGWEALCIDGRDWSVNLRNWKFCKLVSFLTSLY